MAFNMWFRVSPIWFLMINQGLYILYVMVLMRLFEFRKSANLKKYARNSTFLRRWGLLALSVYMLQLLDLFPRIAFTKMTGLDFINHGRQDMLWSTLLMIVAALYFDIILRIWEETGFIIAVLLVPFYSLLMLFPKFREKYSYSTLWKIARERNYLFSFEWFVILITKLVASTFMIFVGFYNVINHTIHNLKNIGKTRVRALYLVILIIFGSFIGVLIGGIIGSAAYLIMRLVPSQIFGFLGGLSAGIASGLLLGFFIGVIVELFSKNSSSGNSFQSFHLFIRPLVSSWKRITFSRINVRKSLYGVEPYYFIEHEPRFQRLEVLAQ